MLEYKDNLSIELGDRVLYKGSEFLPETFGKVFIVENKSIIGSHGLYIHASRKGHFIAAPAYNFISVNNFIINIPNPLNGRFIP